MVKYIIIGILLVLIVILIINKIKNEKLQNKLVETKEVKFHKINEEKTVNKVEEVLRAMQEDLGKQKVDPVQIFEQEQEEKAIISYQELLKTKQSEQEVTTPPAEQPEKVVTPTLQNREGLVSKFENTEIISPIYGRMQAKLEYPTVKKEEPKHMQKEIIFDEHALEKTLNIEPLSAEIKKNEEFLMALKDFRSKL